MKLYQRICAMAGVGALLCLPTAAYSVSHGALQASPVTLYEEIHDYSSLFSVDTQAGDATVLAQSDAISLEIAGTADTTQRITATFLRENATAAQAVAFGKVCGSMLKAASPESDFAAVNAGLQLQDLETNEMRTYSTDDLLFYYGVQSDALRLSVVAMPSVDDGIKIALNDDFLTLDVMPQIVNSRTMVPLRGIFEELGATVTWDNDSRTVTIAGTDKPQICVTIDSKTATVEGSAVAMDTAPMISEGRTLVPVRFLAETLGAQVGWDNATQTVVISAH